MRNIYIYGANRTGTHLLLSLLSGHPDVFTAHTNTGFIRGVYGGLQDFQTAIDRDSIPELMGALWRHTKIWNLKCCDLKGHINYSHKKDEYQSLINTKPVFNSIEDKFLNKICSAGFENIKISNPAKLVDAFFTSWSETEHGGIAKCFVTKLDQYGPEVASPPFVEYLSNLKPKILWMIRDPRSVAASALRRDNNIGWDEKSADRYLWQWKCLHDSLPILKKTFPVFEVSYEKLCTDTKQEMKKISDFIGIDFNESLVIPEFLGQKFEGNSSFGNLGNQVSSESLERWKEVLSTSQLRDIERSVGKRLLEADYEPQFKEEMKNYQPITSQASNPGFIGSILNSRFIQKRKNVAVLGFSFGIAVASVIAIALFRM